jgi:hypothetical protein
VNGTFGSIKINQVILITYAGHVSPKTLFSYILLFQKYFGAKSRLMADYYGF